MYITLSTLASNDIKTHKNALVEIKRLEMFELYQNNCNELVESILNVKNLMEKKIACKIRKNIKRILEEYVNKNVL